MVTHSTVLSINLGNSSHFDNDNSISTAVWAEKVPGRAKNWYFVLPNLTDSLDNKRSVDGVVIELFHGAVLSWDGRLICHCTSNTTVGPGNKCFSAFITSLK